MAKTVLIVDDDKNALEVYTYFFQFKGYDVLPASNGEKALEILAKQKIDLIILDLAMPGMQGEDVMERMAANEAWKTIPIIIDSALGGEESGRPAQIRARFTGKLRFVIYRRPSSLDQIGEAIGNLIAL